ncbi:MAG: hypothetical protein EOO75_14000 [Myxococcales bacterium]|nr:MAG: hypothetical protein EOO75_14000 [Myxococcales bacterium]
MASTLRLFPSVPQAAARRLFVVAFLAAGITTVAPPLHADEPAAPDPAPAAPTARPAPTAHDTMTAQLRDELHMLELQGHVERARARLEHERREREAPAPPGEGTARFRKGTVVLPEVLGVSTISAGGLGMGIAPSALLAVGFTTSEAGYRTTVIGVTPSADVFVSDHVTVGARLQALRTTWTLPSLTPDGAGTFDSHGYALSLAPRVGYVVALSPHILLWPQASLLLGIARNNTYFSPVDPTLTRSLGAEAEFAVAFPLGRHVLARIGPALTYAHTWSRNSYEGDSDRVSAGVRAHLGLAF